MLKILSATQIKELDQFTIDNEPITPIDLMERACHAFTNWLVQHFKSDKKVGIVCGPGNNGGDGLGIARLLKEYGYLVKVWIVRGSLKESESFKINLERLQGKVRINEISTASDPALFIECEILIDAVFGSGLSRAAEGIFGHVISSINQTNAIRVAVDIPSGLFADSHSSGEIVKANHTVSFQLPKLAFPFPENHLFVGKWDLADIGLSKEFIKAASTQNFFVTEN